MGSLGLRASVGVFLANDLKRDTLGFSIIGLGKQLKKREYRMPREIALDKSTKCPKSTCHNLGLARLKVPTQKSIEEVLAQKSIKEKLIKKKRKERRIQRWGC